MNPNNRFKQSDYKINSIGQWPLFQSCTTDFECAKRFSYQGQIKKGNFSDTLLVFKIYLCSSRYNQPSSNLLLSTQVEHKSDWTFYTSEKEVNLLPFFNFIVTDVTETDIREMVVDGQQIKAKIKEVVLAEIPYQNLLEPREIVQQSLIWFDENHESEIH